MNINKIKEFLSKISFGGKWDVCEYTSTPFYKNIDKHIGVCCKETKAILAVCGVPGDEQTEIDIAFISSSPKIIKYLLSENEKRMLEGYLNAVENVIMEAGVSTDFVLVESILKCGGITLEEAQPVLKDSSADDETKSIIIDILKKIGN